MSEKEKNTAKTLAKMLAVLPEGKREFLLGYAEGVTAMAGKPAERDSPPKEKPTGPIAPSA